MVVPQLVTRFLQRPLKLYPRKVGVVDGDRRFTYREYGDRVNRLSNALLGLGVKHGDRVAFLCYNCHQLLEAYYGVVQIGAILLPLNIRLTPADFSYILNDAGARFLFVDKDFVPLIRPIVHELKTVERFFLIADGGRVEGVDWIEYEDLVGPASAAAPPVPDMDENDVAELFYTSGTTGHPKGVMLTHRNLYSNAINFIIAITLTDADVQLHTVPLFHVNGWGTPHALTAVGGTHVMIRQFVPQRVFELIQQEKVTLAAMVPTMVNALINFPDIGRFDLSSFKKLVVGGAPSPVAFVKAAMDKLGCEYVSGYGLSETTPVLTIANIKDYLKDRPGEELCRLRARTGLEVLTVDLRVVNERGEDVRHDGTQIGEIVVRSDVVMKGYWNKPEETARVIVDGWFHTGDMAVIDEEGYVLIVDRKKDIIISGGENIASIEIENTLYSHPAVLENAVIAVPDPIWGEVPKALVVLKPGQSASEEELIEYCRARLARFKVPKAVVFVPSLPRTGTGKILKATLREREWKGFEKRVN